MNVNEEKLLKSGFTNAELQKIKNNVDRFGGTLSEAIQDLANRFRALTWVTTGCVLVFIFLVIFSSTIKIVAGGLSFLLGISIMMFAQPPVLTYKSWRFWRANRN
ncbi:hypothetical protein [Yersinia sp. Marseille-Q3913]|nr:MULTISPECIES: hypothetical protein [Yersinia]MBS0055525.1 hypothetical protein [Yersinia sp. Marseille-Q3913]